MSIIAKNITTSGIEIPDLSGLYIDGLGQVDLLEYFTLDEIDDSLDLDDAIINDWIIINNGVQDLSKEDSLENTALPTVYEVPDNFLDLDDTPTTYSGVSSYVVSVKDDASGLEYTTLSGVKISPEEKFCWQIILAKLRPSMVYEAYSNFTPSGHNVYPIIGHHWRSGTVSEFEHGPMFPQTVVIKSGTPINFDTDGFMLYVKSTEVHSTTDAIQHENPKKEYFKRLKYIQNNDYDYITSWMASNNWNTQSINPGTYGTLLIAYTFNNIREFNILDDSASRSMYHGNIQTDGTLNRGFSRHEDLFLVPFQSTIEVDVRAAKNPSGGGVYTLKYIDVPEWW